MLLPADQPSAAARICAYLAEHGTATRPEMQRELDLHEKCVESATRKLCALGMLALTGGTRREESPRPALVYRLGAVPFDQALFSAGPVPRGRPRKCERPAAGGDLCAALTLALFGRAA